MPQHAPGPGRPRTGRRAAPHLGVAAAVVVATALATTACSGAPTTPSAQPLVIHSASVAPAASTGPTDACALFPAADLAALGVHTPGVPTDLGTAPDRTLTCVWSPAAPTAPALSLTVTVPQDDAGRQRATAEKRQSTAHADGLTPVSGVGDAALLSRNPTGLTVLQFWHGTTQATLTCANAPAGLVPVLTTAATHVAARL